MSLASLGKLVSVAAGKKSVLTLALILALSLEGPLSFPIVYSEEPVEAARELETDRDSFTPATTTAHHQDLIIESALSFINNRVVRDTTSLPELLIRYGLTRDIELRLGQNYEEGGAGNPISGNTPEVGAFLEEEALGEGNEYSSKVVYGGKVAITRQDSTNSWLPSSALILQGFTPTSGENKKSTLSASYVAGWQLAQHLTWDTAIRYGREVFEEDYFDTWSPSTVVKVKFLENWSAHAEYFGIFSDGRSEESTQHYLSPGAHVVLCSRLELGVRVGWGLNDQAPHFFTNAGFGYRFSTS